MCTMNPFVLPEIVCCLFEVVVHKASYLSLLLVNRTFRDCGNRPAVRQRALSRMSR
jgi:hypothetical protein